MRNLRKLTAAVLAVALVLTSMTAVFAADAATVANADNAVTLKDLGLYSGQDANDPKVGLENALTTQDSLIFLAKLFGYFETASALTDDEVAEDLAKFDDAADISNYAKNVVAYSAANGILSGSPDGDKLFVGAKDTVTAARFATFMLKQMDYTVADYKESVAELAETKGSKVEATITGDLTRDDAVGMMYGVLTAEKASGNTVIVDIVGDNADLKAKAEKLGLIVAEVVTTDVAVESVKAINTKQLEVVFNQEMDKDSAESEGFYEVYNNGSSSKTALGDSSAALSDDGKTVTITLNNLITDKLTNSTEAKVIVKKDIKAKSGAKLAKDATIEKIEVEDGIIPTVSKVEATGERNIKVTFSEPVFDGKDDSIATSNFKVESGTYQYFVQSTDLDCNVINLTLGTKLIEGPIDVTVNSDGVEKDYAIVDYAGYKVFKGKTTFNYVKDTSVSVVTVKEAKPKSIKLAFSKPIKATNVDLYHSVKNAANYRATQSTGGKYVDELTFEYGEDSRVPAGTVKLYLVNSGDEDSYEMIDGYGIKVPDQTLTAEIVVDETAPVFSSGDFDTNKKIFLTFDEELESSEAIKEDHYKVKKVSDGDVIDIDHITYEENDKENTVTLYPLSDLDDNTEYIVTVEEAQDIAGNKTTKEYTYTFTTGDNTNPYVKDGTGKDSSNDTSCYAVNADGKIYIAFSEPMNESQMLDLNNYMVDIKDGEGFVELDSDNDKVTKISDRKVLIDLDAKIAEGVTPNVKVAPIMDLAGKRLNGSVDSKEVENIGGEEVKVSKAELIAKNKVKLTFNTQLSSYKNTDVLFVGAGLTESAIDTESVESMVVNDDGNSEVILILNENLQTDVTYSDDNLKNVAISAITKNKDTESESVSGTKLVANDPITIEDKTAPEIVKYDHDTDDDTDDVAKVVLDAGTDLYDSTNKVKEGTVGTISIYFSEAIKNSTLSTLSFTVKGYTVTDVKNNTPNIVVLTVKADADNTSKRTSVTQAFNISDDDGNVLASGSSWTVR